MLRDKIILPDMVGVYNSKTFDQVGIRPEMISHHLQSCEARWPGLGAIPSSASNPSSSLLGCYKGIECSWGGGEGGKCYVGLLGTLLKGKEYILLYPHPPSAA